MKNNFMIYYEDIVIDEPIDLGHYHVKKEEVIEFAKKWDPQPYHIDEAAAKTSLIGALSACSIHILAVLSRATAHQSQIPFLANLETEYRILRPMLVGDTVYFEAMAKKKRLSESKPYTGIVRFHATIKNQDEETILYQKGTVMVACRPNNDDKTSAFPDGN
jgi:acyl dehydratase